jgi:hypothetical protein
MSMLASTGLRRKVESEESRTTFRMGQQNRVRLSTSLVTSHHMPFPTPQRGQEIYSTRTIQKIIDTRLLLRRGRIGATQLSPIPKAKTNAVYTIGHPGGKHDSDYAK